MKQRWVLNKGIVAEGSFFVYKKNGKLIGAFKVDTIFNKDGGKRWWMIRFIDDKGKEQLVNYTLARPVSLRK